MSEYIFSIHEIVEHIFENLDLRTKLHFISCNKFLSYTYSHLIRINDAKCLTNKDIKRKFFNNCTSCKLSSKLEKYPIYLKKVFLIDLEGEILSDIPECITHLTLSCRCIYSINDLNKFINLTHLTFDLYFNKPIKDFPKSITHLTFGECFNKPINNLPECITHLTFGNCFNKSIINLPECITHLTFGYHFNQPIEGLPKSITHDVPKSVIYLKFLY